MKLFSISKAFLCLYAFIIISFSSKLSLADVEITPDIPLSFGSFSFVDFINPIEITIDTANNFTANSNTVILSNPVTGRYTITGGSAGNAYSVTAPSSVDIIDNGSTGKFILDNIVLSPASSSFDGFGEADLAIGGRLRSEGSGARYKNGNYSADIILTVNY
jgi:hypothetical protein